MDNLPAPGIIAALLLLLCGITSYFWRANPLQEALEKRLGIIVTVMGFCVLGLTGLWVISTPIFLLGGLVAVGICLATIWLTQ